MTTGPKKTEYLQGLLKELRSLPKETEWAEFKHNNIDFNEIGEYISALSNSAALHGKTAGYLVWGIEDNTHEIIGTSFQPEFVKKGNEELENWLLRLLSPKINFYFHKIETENGNVVICEIDRAVRHPVQFQGIEYIRVGSYKKKLKDFPEKERELWRIFDQTPWEDMIALEDVSAEDVLHLIDYPAYFDLSNIPLPDNRKGILDRLAEETIISPTENGTWKISNLGALLYAKKLDSFAQLKRKAIRVIIYKGNSKLESLKENTGAKGYAVGFEGLIDFIKNIIPSNEIIGNALRKDVPMYPEIAIRELVANALIHQDFFIRGTGPMVEIYSNRMEITNPGLPLVKTERFLDTPPKSRNESLAAMMRRIGVCEERGSGIDKVVFQTELFQLPAPLFEITEDHTRTILFAHRPYSEMDRKERIRATYLHACLKYVQRDYMTNSTLRDRFGIEKGNSAMVSRVIKDALEDRAIKPVESDNESRRHAKYWPIWA